MVWLSRAAESVTASCKFMLLGVICRLFTGVVKMEWMVKKSGAHRLLMAENTFEFHFLFTSAGETHLRNLQTLKTWRFHISCRKTKGPLRHSNVFFNGCYANAVWIWGGFPIFYCWQGGNTHHWVHKAIYEIRCKNLKEFSKGLSKLLLPKALNTVTLSLWCEISERPQRTPREKTTWTMHPQESFPGNISAV